LAQGGETGVAADSELVALIAYLQRLGKPGAPPPENAAPVQVSLNGQGGE
jgi:hypothetical protein